MQLNSVDNVSFGRIGFANKSVKKAFYEALDKPRFTSRYADSRVVMKSFSKFLIEKENGRHDRLLRIGMTKINGKDYFINATNNEVLGTTKRGRQNIPLFLIDLMKYNK